MEPLVKTNTYERGSYHCFEPSIFETVRKVSFCKYYTLSVVLLNSSSCSQDILFYSPITIVLFLGSNVQPPCRIILFFIMKCWKRDPICLNIEEETKTLLFEIWQKMPQSKISRFRNKWLKVGSIETFVARADHKRLA